MNKAKTTCSDCSLAVTIDMEAGTLSATLPSNGKRGAGHVPARKVVEGVGFDLDECLALWECPGCGYSDSTYVDPKVRKELA